MTQIQTARPPTEAEAAALFAPVKNFGLGCHFTTVVVDTLLMGILAWQYLRYISNMKNDGRLAKFTATWSFINCCLMSCYIWFFTQHLFVQNFGLYAPLFETRYLSWFTIMDSVHVSVVQMFLAHRAFLLLDRQWAIIIIVGLLVMTHIAGGLAVTIMFLGLHSELDAFVVVKPYFTWLSSTMSADIVITISIMVGLWRSRTGWVATDSTIMRLIRMTLEAQLPPLCIAIAFLISYAKNPASLLGATLQGIIGKVYGVGLLFALNSRSTFNRDNSNKSVQVKSQFGNRTEIRIDTETHTHVNGPGGPYSKTKASPYDDSHFDKTDSGSLEIEMLPHGNGTSRTKLTENSD